MSEKKFDTDKFPWVTNEEFVAYYSDSLTAYMGNMFKGNEKTHITDLSAASAAFSEAWWAIFDNFERQ